jgi:hypothetical protein
MSTGDPRRVAHAPSQAPTGGIVTRVEQRGVQWIRNFLTSPRPEGRCGLLLVVCGLAVICGAAAWIGAVPTHVCGHDTFFLLDNAWRAINGQRVHIDYSSPWGPLTFLVVALGLKLSGYTVDGIGYGSALFGLAVGTWGWTLTRHRLAPTPRLLVSFYLAALSVAPYPLGYGILSTSHAMVYNRYGYALTGLIVLECFAPHRRAPAAGADRLAGFSSGAAAGLLLFLKISYFVAAGGIVIGSLCLDGISRRRLRGGIFGFALVATAMLVYLHGDLAAMLRDWQMAAGAKATNLTAHIFTSRLSHNVPYLLLYAVGGFLIRRDDTLGRNHCLLMGLVIVTADAFLMLTNQQPSQLPLSNLFALLVVSQVLEVGDTARPDAPGGSAAYGDAIVLIGALLFLSQFGLDVAGLGFGATLKARPGNLAAIERFREPRLSALILYDDPGEPSSNGRIYTRYVNEGCALLRAQLQPGETVLTIDMMNPFPYALGERPPAGGIAAAAYRYTLSDAYHPSDDAFFGNADVVMVPKRPASPPWFFDGFYHLYEHALHKRFRLVAETERWYLYHRT